MASTAARGRLPDPLPRRADREGPRRRRRPQPRLLRRDRCQPRRRAGRARALVSTLGGRQVLARGAERAEATRRPRRLGLLRRRAEGLPRGDRGCLPPGLGADLHRAPDPPVAALRPGQAPPRRRQGPEADLHRGRRRRRRGIARVVRTGLGRALPDDRQDVARDLGARDPLPRLPHRRASRRLHHEHDRGAAPADPQDDQNPRTLPNRGGRPQTDLPLDHQRTEELEDRLQLERSTAFIQNPLRRPTALTHRKSDSLRSSGSRPAATRPRRGCCSASASPGSSAPTAGAATTTSTRANDNSAGPTWSETSPPTAKAWPTRNSSATTASRSPTTSSPPGTSTNKTATGPVSKPRPPRSRTSSARSSSTPPARAREPSTTGSSRRTS